MEDNRNGWHTDGDGTRRHFCNRLLDREDGPAVIDKGGSQWWFRNGKCHREDGPAVIYPDGSLHWYLNGKPTDMETVLDTPEKREAYLLEESLRRL